MGYGRLDVPAVPRSGPAMARLEAAIRQHPDLERELRELFATARMADDLALLDTVTGGTEERLSFGSPSSPSAVRNSSDGGWGSGSWMSNADVLQVAAGAGRGQRKSMFSLIGSRIGDYSIEAEVGRGGMGVVYRATDEVLQRTVAVKTVNMALERDGADQFEGRPIRVRFIWSRPAPDTPRWEQVSLTERQVARPQEGLIVIGYHVAAHRGDEHYEAHCTSVIRRLEHEVWRVVQHQQTPVLARSTSQA